MRLGKFLFLELFFFFLFCLFFIPLTLQAQTTPDDIQSKIDSRSADIKNLEKEIAEYQKQINDLGSKASTLSDTLQSLNLTQKKLQADIELTKDKIETKNLEIKQLNSKIGGTEESITDEKRFISESFRKMGEVGDFSIPRLLLSGQSIAETWTAVNRLSLLQGGLQIRITDLGKAKNRLETTRSATERAKAELISLQDQLNDQRDVVLATKDEQTALLRDTRNSETTFQAMLDEKKSLKDAFERELIRFESELKLTVDPSSLPKTGQSILAWPLDNIFITQYFGNTPYSTANSQLYNGVGHNGIDFRATIGTPVRVALSGVVAGTGNTDIISGCYSLGKWILVRHPDGLSTLYAHMSVQSVSQSQNVTTGDVIGYSGNTGYTTGPHLHFGVYASSGIEIKQFVESAHCQGAVLPIAVLKAYLNPLSYLPEGGVGENGN